jgi:hypothetical protein
VKLRTLNKSHGSVHGGDKMHVIGQPFIKGPSLSIIFSTPHGDVTALNPEMYSDSVLFFEAPSYPCPAIFSPYSRDHVREVKVMVQVTNDGRTMSNPLEFTYIAGKPPCPLLSPPLSVVFPWPRLHPPPPRRQTCAPSRLLEQRSAGGCGIADAAPSLSCSHAAAAAACIFFSPPQPLPAGLLFVHTPPPQQYNNTNNTISAP